MDPTAFTPFSSLFGGVLIGVAAVLMMATTGRIAGVSGFVSRLLPPYEDEELLARLAFVAGLVLAPLLYMAVSGTKVAHVVSSNLPLLAIAGLLVGAGAVVGGGCKSGHGVSGMARLSWRSMAATVTFMATAIVTVFVVRHLAGG
jgi:uncharacterized membrane protein YedE/YeeE